MKKNKLIKNIIGLVVTFVVIFNCATLVNAVDSSITITHYPAINDPSGIQTPVLKNNNDYVICVDPSLDPPNGNTCNISNDWTPEDRYAIGAVLDKLNKSSGGESDKVGSYISVNVYLYNKYGHYYDHTPLGGYIQTGDSIVNYKSAVSTYKSFINSVATPTKPSISINVDKFTFTKVGSNWESNEFTLVSNSGSVSTSLSPSYAKLEQIKDGSSGKYKIVVPMDKITSETTIKLTINKEVSVPYARKYVCGDKQPVAKLYYEELSDSDSAEGTITPEPENKPQEIKVLKVDTSGSNKIAGAVLELFAADNSYVIRWNTTDENPKIFDDLVIGKQYCVTEISAPDGYEKDTSSHCFTVKDDSNAPQEIKVYNKKEDTPMVGVQKVDSVTKKGLSGAKFHIENSSGETVVSQWTSNGSMQYFELDYGTYYLVEDEAPAGYIRDTERKQFTLSKSKPTDFVTMQNTPKPSLKILKVDEKGNALSGAKLQLLDTNKTTVLDEWVTDGKEHTITKIDVVAGKKYYVKEIEAPEGYLLNEELAEVVLKTGETKTVKFVNTKNGILIKKVDADDKTENVIGATLHIEDNNGKKIGTSWITDGNPHSIEKLDPGTYYLVEEKAPDGYVRNTSKVKFTVTDNETKVIEVVMTNKKSEVEISKQDATTGKELPGAKLKLTDEKGNVIEEWVSIDKPYVIKGLKDGKYKLTETIAPEGYTLSTKTVEFEVKEGKVDKKVVMTNELTPVPSTGGSRSTLLLFVAMLDIALGIGIITYVRKNRLQQ